MTKTIYNICASASNVYSRKHWQSVVNSDDKLADSSHDAQEFSSDAHAISFIKQRGQALANECTAHTHVEFYVERHEIGGEGDEVIGTTIYSQQFEIQK